MNSEQARVKVIRDTMARQGFVVPAGSVLLLLRELQQSYKGWWCSMEGSYMVTVPKRDCRALSRSKTPNDRGNREPTR